MSEGLPNAGFSEMSKRKVDSDMTDTAKGKIRYIGGYVVAKSNHQTYITVQQNAFKFAKDKVEKYELGKRTLKLIHCMKYAESSLQNSDFPESLKETAIKQNINRGLINITNLAFKFFECLINTVLSFLNGDNVNKYGSGIHKYVTESVNKDANLHQNFISVVQTASVDDLSFDTDNT
ncbi:hypothetical protein DPMN_171180 [Dreissena polymorpha]|uniref:Uncharacterized protein n=1 Tax=Dreissena polymorpha TaxID=45954 RepID=A0A9D4DXL9_DREPO|nr:hypothetical protein DPMN_171180 [Dreissena polymorpha]